MGLEIFLFRRARDFARKVGSRTPVIDDLVHFGRDHILYDLCNSLLFRPFLEHADVVFKLRFERAGAVVLFLFPGYVSLVIEKNFNVGGERRYRVAVFIGELGILVAVFGIVEVLLQFFPEKLFGFLIIADDILVRVAGIVIRILFKVAYHLFGGHRYLVGMSVLDRRDSHIEVHYALGCGVNELLLEFVLFFFVRRLGAVLLQADYVGRIHRRGTGICRVEIDVHIEQNVLHSEICSV